MGLWRRTLERRIALLEAQVEALGAVPVTKRVGRPRIYATNAERQAAYRRRRGR